MVCLGNLTADTQSAESSRLPDAELGGNIYPEEKYHQLRPGRNSRRNPTGI